MVNKLLAGTVTVRGKKLPKAVVTGVLAVVFLYVGVAGTVSVVVPWSITSGDTRAHIDYVWRVYNGEIPRFNDGFRYPPFGSRKIQPQANHPPLFYMVNAPFVGPFLAQGKWEQAIAVARAVNIFIGVLCVVALAWAGWLLGGKRRQLFAVAVPAIAALAYRFTTLNVVYGADGLLTLLSTLTFINIYKIITQGIQRRYVLALLLLSVAGMATKATYIVMLAASCLSLLIAAYVHTKGKNEVEKKRQFGRAVICAGLIILAVALATGWFYYSRNYQTTGSWFRASPSDYSHGRDYKSLRQVVTGNKLWQLFYAEYTENILLSTALSSVALAGVLGLKKLQLKRLLGHPTNRIMAGILFLAVLGMLTVQVAFAVGYGAINFRYVLPVLLPLALFLAYGFLEFKWARGQLVTLAAFLMGITTILPVASSSTMKRLVPELAVGGLGHRRIFVAATHNGIPVMMTALLLVLFAVGAVLLAASLYRLSARDT